MRRRTFLLFLALPLALVGFTACDEVIIDALAEDLSLSVSSFAAELHVEKNTEESSGEVYYEAYEYEGIKYKGIEAEKYAPGYEAYARYVYIPLPIPEPELPTEPFIEPPRYKIALTFDDGPSRFTNPILDILEAHNARATFFVLGYRIHSQADTIRRTADLGSEVLGHSWNHRNFAELSADAIRRQIVDTSDALTYVLGEAPPLLMRPPYGIITARVRNVSEELGYSLVNWSVDPQDWKNRCADTIYQLVMENAVDGAIVLLHDIRIYTQEAMERAIPSLIEKGFELVTVSELLEYLYHEVVPGNVYHGRRPTGE